MRTLVGAAEPEPRPWNVGQPVGYPWNAGQPVTGPRHPTVLPILTGPQPQWPAVDSTTTTNMTAVVWFATDREPEPAGPIRVQATVGRPVPEIEAPKGRTRDHG